MQRDISNDSPYHPSSKELADFVDGTLNEDRRAEITKHLIECDECSDVVALVMKYGKKKLEVVNNIYYKGLGIALSGLVVSLSILFIININQFTLGKFSLSEQIRKNTLSATYKPIKNKIIDGDEVVKEIEKSLDLTSIKSFLKAEEAEKKGNFKLALDLYYDDAFEEVNSTLSGEEQLKWRILIYYRISRINFQEGIEDNESYKNITKEWIQEYILNK